MLFASSSWSKTLKMIRVSRPAQISAVYRHCAELDDPFGTDANRQAYNRNLAVVCLSIFDLTIIVRHFLHHLWPTFLIFKMWQSSGKWAEADNKTLCTPPDQNRYQNRLYPPPNDWRRGLRFHIPRKENPSILRNFSHKSINQWPPSGLWHKLWQNELSAVTHARICMFHPCLQDHQQSANLFHHLPD